jgi:hypothetical protein
MAEGMDCETGGETLHRVCCVSLGVFLSYGYEQNKYATIGIPHVIYRTGGRACVGRKSVSTTNCVYCDPRHTGRIVRIGHDCVFLGTWCGWKKDQCKGKNQEYVSARYWLR